MDEVEIEVNIEGNRANMREILEAMDRTDQQFWEKAYTEIAEQRIAGIVDLLCRRECS